MFNAKPVSIGATVGIVSLLSACALQVRSDVNPRQSIATCHTYSWAPEVRDPRTPREANPLNAERLRAAIDSNLQMRGLRLVETPPGVPAAPGAPGVPGPGASGAAGPGGTGADCMVGFEVGSQRYIEGFMPGPGPGWGWGMGFGWGWRRGYASLGWEEPYVYREGFIAVDLYDAKTRVPLWHAVVSQDISGLTGSKAEQKIDAAIAAIFTKYPT
jgi:hypothetical protein